MSTLIGALYWRNSLGLGLKSKALCGIIMAFILGIILISVVFVTSNIPEGASMAQTITESALQTIIETIMQEHGTTQRIVLKLDIQYNM